MSNITAEELMIWWANEVEIKTKETEHIIEKSKEEINELKKKKGDLKNHPDEICVINREILKISQKIEDAEEILEANKIRMADIAKINHFIENYQQHNP